MSRISRSFKRLNKNGKKAMIAYIMAGDPSINATKKYIMELESSGADIIELGVPFTDPLADGPTIQRAAERALKEGVTLKKVLELVSQVRANVKVPLVLMTYYNPVFKFGIEAFVKQAVDAGVDGIIVPDLIPEEAGDLIDSAKRYKLDTIFLLAPTSTPDRIKRVVRASTGFIYYVSITGITGGELSLNDKMVSTLGLIKEATSKPAVVGFGISRPDEASTVAALADGIVIGSAIVKLISEGGDIKGFVESIKEAIDLPCGSQK
jgi:tryptophan synthase alpha chain